MKIKEQKIEPKLQQNRKSHNHDVYRGIRIMRFLKIESIKSLAKIFVLVAAIFFVISFDKIALYIQSTRPYMINKMDAPYIYLQSAYNRFDAGITNIIFHLLGKYLSCNRIYNYLSDNIKTIDNSIDTERIDEYNGGLDRKKIEQYMSHNGASESSDVLGASTMSDAQIQGKFYRASSSSSRGRNKKIAGIDYAMFALQHHGCAIEIKSLCVNNLIQEVYPEICQVHSKFIEKIKSYRVFKDSDIKVQKIVEFINGNNDIDNFVFGRRIHLAQAKNDAIHMAHMQTIDGIRSGNLVIDDLGVVGRISRVNPRSVTISSVFDDNFRIAVIIQRSEKVGLMEVHNGVPILKHIEQIDIVDGDAVLTYGDHEFIPMGFYIGSVNIVDNQVLVKIPERSEKSNIIAVYKDFRLNDASLNDSRNDQMNTDNAIESGARD